MESPKKHKLERDEDELPPMKEGKMEEEEEQVPLIEFDLPFLELSFMPPEQNTAEIKASLISFIDSHSFDMLEYWEEYSEVYRKEGFNIKEIQAVRNDLEKISTNIKKFKTNLHIRITGLNLENFIVSEIEIFLDRIDDFLNKINLLKQYININFNNNDLAGLLDKTESYYKDLRIFSDKLTNSKELIKKIICSDTEENAKKLKDDDRADIEKCISEYNLTSAKNGNSLLLFLHFCTKPRGMEEYYSFYFTDKIFYGIERILDEKSSEDKQRLIDATHRICRTMLHVAAAYNLIRLTKWLLDNNCNIFIKHSKIGYAFTHAVTLGNLEIAKLILEHAKKQNADLSLLLLDLLNTTDWSSIPFIHAEVPINFIHIISQLLLDGAELNFTTRTLKKYQDLAIDTSDKHYLVSIVNKKCTIESFTMGILCALSKLQPAKMYKFQTTLFAKREWGEKSANSMFANTQLAIAILSHVFQIFDKEALQDLQNDRYWYTYLTNLRILDELIARSKSTIDADVNNKIRHDILERWYAKISLRRKTPEIEYDYTELDPEKKLTDSERMEYQPFINDLENEFFKSEFIVPPINPDWLCMVWNTAKNNTDIDLPYENLVSDVNENFSENNVQMTP